MNTALPGETPSAHTPLRQILLTLASFGITFAVVLSVAGAYCYYLPRLYYSRVKMEMRSGNSTNVQVQRDPNLQPSQFQILQSKEILYPVIDNLKLVETWSAQEESVLPKEEIYRILLGRMQLAPIRNTNLIELGVLSKDRVEAATIANRIAVVYQKVLLDDQMKILDAGLAQLKEEVLKQRKSVEVAHQEMQKIRQQSGIADPNPELLEPIQSTAPQSQEQAEAVRQYLDAKARYCTGNKLLEAAVTRLSSESLQLKMQVRPVKIWEKAEPSIYPSTPTPGKIAVIMGGGAVAGLFFGTLAALVTAVLLPRKH